MHDVLRDRLFEMRTKDGRRERGSLPEVYHAMMQDRVECFPGLRAHQQHAWHAFLAQMGAMAMVRKDSGKRPDEMDADEWRTGLRMLTEGFPLDEPWHLVLEDEERPAFLQCPITGDARGNEVRTPDGIDLLVTAKSHGVKPESAWEATPEDWVYALVSVQTMAGYQGAKRYQIARMNGGHGSRPCLGLAPADGGPGAHLRHDIERMMATRSEVIGAYPGWYMKKGGQALLWTEAWDGKASDRIERMDPWFVEICRRIRLESRDGRIGARTLGSGAARLDAKEAKGDLGDHWTPVNVKEGKSLSFAPGALRYDRLAEMLTEAKMYRLPQAVRSGGRPGERMRLVVRSIASGQGKTEGYHERGDIVLEPETVGALGTEEGRAGLARAARAVQDDMEVVRDALRAGVVCTASGGKPSREWTRADRRHAGRYTSQLDQWIDTVWFEAWEHRAWDGDPEHRIELARGLVAEGRRLVGEAIEALARSSGRNEATRRAAIKQYWQRVQSEQSALADIREAVAPGEERMRRAQIPGEPARGPEAERTWGERIVDLAQEIGRLRPGPASVLRKGPLEGGGKPVFWRLLTKHGEDKARGYEEGWAALMQGIALMSPKGEESGTLHEPGIETGAGLCRAGIGPGELRRLLHAPAHDRLRRAVELCRSIGRMRPQLDLRPLARWIVYGDLPSREEIARGYHREAARDYRTMTTEETSHA